MSMKVVAGHNDTRKLGTVGQKCCKKNKTVVEAIIILYCFLKVMIHPQGDKHVEGMGMCHPYG